MSQCNISEALWLLWRDSDVVHIHMVIKMVNTAVTLVTVVVAALGLSGLNLPGDRQQEVRRVVGLDDVFWAG